MNGNVIQLYKLHTRELEAEKVFFSHYKEMSQERREKVDAYRFLKDKKLALGAGILMDRGLGVYGLRERTARLAVDRNGKPFLPDYPKIHFNLSHSEQMVIAVFAATEVGCDIEYMAPVDLWLAHRFFCPSEYAYILAQREEQAKQIAFYRLWTLKESFIKATGLGMLLPLAQFCIELDKNISVRQQVDNAAYEFREHSFGGYRLSVCLRYECSGNTNNMM